MRARPSEAGGSRLRKRIVPNFIFFSFDADMLKQSTRNKQNPPFNQGSGPREASTRNPDGEKTSNLPVRVRQVRNLGKSNDVVAHLLAQRSSNPSDALWYAFQDRKSPRAVTQTIGAAKEHIPTIHLRPRPQPPTDNLLKDVTGLLQSPTNFESLAMDAQVYASAATTTSPVPTTHAAVESPGAPRPNKRTRYATLEHPLPQSLLFPVF